MGDLAVPPKVIDKTPMAKGDQSDISGRFALPTMSAEGPTSPTEHREGAEAPPRDHMSDEVMTELVERCSKNVIKSIQENLEEMLSNRFPKHKSRSSPNRESRPDHSHSSDKRSRSRQRDIVSSNEEEGERSEHSPHPSDDDRSEDENSSENYESERFSSYSYDNENPRKRKRYSVDTETPNCFPCKGETYIEFNKKFHRYLTPTTVLWRGDIINVKWLSSQYCEGDIRSAFCQIKSTSPSGTLYMDHNAAHETLIDSLNLEHWTGDSPGLKRKGFPVEFNTSSGLGQTMKFLNTKVPEVIQAILSDTDEATIQKLIPESTFSAPSMAIFSKNWPNTEDYLAWAKGEILSLTQAAQSLDIDAVNKVTNKMLEEERDTRALLVNNITGLQSLELFGDNLKDKVKLATAQAIAKLFLPNIKFLLISWISAKLRIRQKILHDQDNTAARILLKSNVWDPVIFPKEAIDQAMKKDKNDLRHLLNLSNKGELTRALTNTSFQYKRQKQYGQRRFYENRNKYDKPFRDSNTYKGNYKKKQFTNNNEEASSYTKKYEGKNNSSQGSSRKAKPFGGKKFGNSKNSTGNKNQRKFKSNS